MIGVRGECSSTARATGTSHDDSEIARHRRTGGVIPALAFETDTHVTAPDSAITTRIRHLIRITVVVGDWMLTLGFQG